MEGLIILDKPAGMTSAQAVQAVKNRLPPGVKIGHAGTLDHFATGVLILLLGKATRQAERIMSWPKTYEATIKLGKTSPTDDPDSDEQSYAMQVTEPAETQIDKTLQSFVGAIAQQPPTYSAVKLSGTRASDRARKGQTVQLKARIVQVYSIENLGYEWPLLNIRVQCGRGTYIRAIARDLGRALNVGGYLLTLQRTCVGRYNVANAIKFAQLSKINLQELQELVIPLAGAGDL